MPITVNLIAAFASVGFRHKDEVHLCVCRPHVSTCRKNTLYYFLIGEVVFWSYRYVFADATLILSVGDWLADLELLEYENLFIGNGYDDMDFMVRVQCRV